MERLMRLIQMVNVFVLLLCVTGGTAQGAADITWSSPATISGTGDVSTSGTLVFAYNIGGTGVSATTINGVNFAAFPIVDGSGSTTDGTLTVSGFSSEPMNSTTPLGFASTPFSNLSASYQAMLSTGVIKSSNTFHFLDMMFQNLTVGQSYALQVWTNNSNATTSSASVWDFNGNNVQAIDVNTTNADGGVGQYILGTFTAGATTEYFFIHGEPFATGFAVLNGLQLRATVAVPEPSTLFLLALAAPLFVPRRFRRAKVGLV